MNLYTFAAFCEELQKVAVATPSLLSHAGHFLRQSPVRTAAIGAGVGAAGGAAANPEDRVGGALRGAGVGAAVGGIGAGGARAVRDTQLLAGKPLTAGQTVTETAKRLGSGALAFGKRQIHGLTGAFADPAKTRIRSSVEAARQQKLLDARLADDLRFARSPAHAKKIEDSARSAKESLKEWGESGDRALEAGITSVPGLVKGLASRKTRGKVLGAVKDEVLGGPGAGGLARGASVGLGVALPAALGVHDLSKGDESAQGGRTVGQKAMNLATNLGVGTLTLGMPIPASMMVSTGADMLGEKLMSPRWTRTNRSLAGQRPGLPLVEGA